MDLFDALNTLTRLVRHVICTVPGIDQDVAQPQRPGPLTIDAATASQAGLFTFVYNSRRASV